MVDPNLIQVPGCDHRGLGVAGVGLRHSLGGSIRVPGADVVLQPVRADQPGGIQGSETPGTGSFSWGNAALVALNATILKR